MRSPRRRLAAVPLIVGTVLSTLLLGAAAQADATAIQQSAPAYPSPAAFPSVRDSVSTDTALGTVGKKPKKHKKPKPKPVKVAAAAAPAAPAAPVDPATTAPAVPAAAPWWQADLGTWQAIAPAGDPSSYALFEGWPRFDPCTPITWGVDLASVDAVDPADRDWVLAVTQDVFSEISTRTGYQFTRVDVADGAGRPVDHGTPAENESVGLLLTVLIPSAAAPGDPYATDQLNPPAGANYTYVGVGGPNRGVRTASGTTWIEGGFASVSRDVLTRASTNYLHREYLHEVSHAMGLDHPAATDQVMTPAGSAWSMQAGDIGGLGTLVAGGCRP